MGALQINMLGTSFTIRAKEDEAYLAKLLKYYRQISDQVSRGEPLSNVQNAILTGLMICDELYKEKSKKSVERNLESQIKNQESENDAKIQNITSSLIKRLDVALGE